jgi:hypothetical protein
VPILGEDYVREASGKQIDEGNDGVALLNGEPAVSAEISLHVDDEE